MNEFPFIPTIVPSRLQVENFTAEESLRDYFAAQALSGLMSDTGNLISQDLEWIARRAFALADAMMKVRA